LEKQKNRRSGIGVGETKKKYPDRHPRENAKKRRKNRHPVLGIQDARTLSGKNSCAGFGSPLQYHAVVDLFFRTRGNYHETEGTKTPV